MLSSTRAEAQYVVKRTRSSEVVGALFRKGCARGRRRTFSLFDQLLTAWERLESRQIREAYDAERRDFGRECRTIFEQRFSLWLYIDRCIDIVQVGWPGLTLGTTLAMIFFLSAESME
ncbi:hypothetical protein TSA66_09760 [Noviherbaspirillum autotrophicum]|uniref:Uncharacterized protein n=1 Tax=Noviherbaspirillum autotrophicum TaxID=709839 RepID=A0A0C1YKM0_9BURK|nr:hypothetical protein TSA66_09760 [Noviherbaspirillum autotrophicum]